RGEGDRAAEGLLGLVELPLLEPLLALGHEGEADAVEVEDVPFDPQAADLREGAPRVLGVARALPLPLGRPQLLERRAVAPGRSRAAPCGRPPTAPGSSCRRAGNLGRRSLSRGCARRARERRGA